MSTDLLPQLQAAFGVGYRFEKELGGGGMSRVFVATELDLARRVVVKVLAPELAAGVSVDRFRRETQLAASLQHPHIVPLLTAGAAGDLLYYTMPLVEGESLRSRLAREGELPVRDALRILRDVADALAYAHGRDLVHRDIKPDNVLLSGGHALVADFGIAKALSQAAGSSGLTSVGVAIGTPTYMAPEQAAGDPNVDHRADLYAFGTMAYEMLAGRPPFAGMSPHQMLAAHVTEPIEPVTKHRPQLPRPLAELVMWCVEKNPADRPQTAAELVPALEGLSTPTGGTTSVRFGRRRAFPWKRAIVVAGGVLGLGAGGWLALRGGGVGWAGPQPRGRRAVRRPRSRALALAGRPGGRAVPQSGRSRTAPDRVTDPGRKALERARPRNRRAGAGTRHRCPDRRLRAAAERRTGLGPPPGYGARRVHRDAQ